MNMLEKALKNKGYSSLFQNRTSDVYKKTLYLAVPKKEEETVKYVFDSLLPVLVECNAAVIGEPIDNEYWNLLTVYISVDPSDRRAVLAYDEVSSNRMWKHACISKEKLQELINKDERRKKTEEERIAKRAAKAEEFKKDFPNRKTQYENEKHRKERYEEIKLRVVIGTKEKILAYIKAHNPGITITDFLRGLIDEKLLAENKFVPKNDDGDYTLCSETVSTISSVYRLYDKIAEALNQKALEMNQGKNVTQSEIDFLAYDFEQTYEAVLQICELDGKQITRDATTESYIKKLKIIRRNTNNNIRQLSKTADVEMLVEKHTLLQNAISERIPDFVKVQRCDVK